MIFGWKKDPNWIAYFESKRDARFKQMLARVQIEAEIGKIKYLQEEHHKEYSGLFSKKD